MVRRTTSTPRWEQAFSDDGGLTWETNWVMEFTPREGHDVRRPGRRECDRDYQHMWKVISPGPAMTLGGRRC